MQSHMRTLRINYFNYRTLSMPATTTVAPSVLLEYRLQKQINLFAFTNKSPLLLFHFCSVFVIHFSLFFLSLFLCCFLLLFIEASHEFQHRQKNLLSMEKMLTNQHKFHSQSIKKTLKTKTHEKEGEKEEERVRILSALFTIC